MNSIVKRMEHAERIAERALGRQRQFAADASHELLTPIAGIRAQLEVARLYPDDVSEAIEGALRATTRLEAIVADLLLLAGIGAATLAESEEIDLGQLVAAELGRRPGRRPTRLHLTSRVIVGGLRPLLSRMVACLLDNAERHAATSVHVEVRREGERAVLAVTNDGEAIPEAERERVFDRFYRRDAARSRSNGGPGLGLAIAREVAEAHGGRIAVQDAEPGSRFVVSLPLAPSGEVVVSYGRRAPVIRSRTASSGRGPTPPPGVAARGRFTECGEAASGWRRDPACAPRRPSARPPMPRSACGS
ncbi:sensor histidine kinase [Microbispora sp. ATCC PTA-5024]|uniref:sensor histidine kinase n=1 Tax=Microbispora sp. ATCC PTA-5024 TaxID=316330 RepID=UPI000A0021AB|nr:HAMP domain-containing sensor histidine kinase [Microbispora sp. ATCC PTA-5024]